MLSHRILLRPGVGLPGIGSGSMRRATTAMPSFTSRAFFSSSPLTFASSSSSSSSASSLLLLARRRLAAQRTPISLVSPRFASTVKTLPKKFPERILVYHAGTPRTTLLACLKVTTLFGLAFFTFLVAPAYVAAGKPWTHVLAMVTCGIVPFAVIAYTSLPFVVFVHLRLPAYVRHAGAGAGADPDLLRRFVRNIPPATHLDITTMNLIGRPRVTSVPVSDLVPAHERFGIVNLCDTRQSILAPAAAAAAGAPPKITSPAAALAAPPNLQTKLVVFSSTYPWIHLRPVTRFGAPAGNNTRGVKYAWAWEELLAIIQRRAAQPHNKGPST